jgi:hypothetical protein
MTKALPYAPIFLNDLLGECAAAGLGFRERGIVLTLLWIQHIAGALPADPRELRRLVGGDARLNEIRRVVNIFFPVSADGRRRNAQHAKARDTAVRAYEAKVSGGIKGAARRWGHDG